MVSLGAGAGASAAASAPSVPSSVTTAPQSPDDFFRMPAGRASAAAAGGAAGAAATATSSYGTSADTYRLCYSGTTPTRTRMTAEVGGRATAPSRHRCGVFPTERAVGLQVLLQIIILFFAELTCNPFRRELK